ncbi:MAG TPA: hypothetical protein VEY95_01940 [Azospirillaceae bacterium]|nr:hypothetical protein [Azospirillaceae bacterium]
MTRRPVPAPSRLRPLKAAFVLMSVAAAIVSLPSVVLLAVGMIPTLVAYIIDDDDEKLAPITVGALNFAGVLPLLFELWQGGGSMPQLRSLAASPAHWLLMYGAAAFGWAIYFAVPPVIGSTLIAKRQAKVQTLRAEQMKLVGAWGEDVRGLAEVDGTEPLAGPADGASAAPAQGATQGSAVQGD